MNNIQKLIDEGFNVHRTATGEIKTRCPKCSDSRRKSREQCVSVNVDEGTWYCHHCSWKGSVNGNGDMENRDRSVPQTLSRSRSNNGNGTIETIDNDELKKPLDDERIDQLESGRGLSKEVLEYFDIRYGEMYRGGNTYPCIQFPYHKDGELVNVKTRGSGKRFKMVSGADLILFNLDDVEEGEPLIITEGEFDAMAAYEAREEGPDGSPWSDIPPTVSVPTGANKRNNNLSFLNECMDELESVSEFILAIDDDEAGKVLRKELSRRLGKGKCRVVNYPEDCKDLNEVLLEHGEEKVREVIRNAKPYPIDGIIYVSDMEKDLIDLYEGGFDRGVSTGWRNVDQKYRVRKGLVTILTGIPTHGKSTFVDNLAVNLARQHDWKIAICSPEHWPPAHHAARMMAKWARKPFHTDFDGRMSKDEVNAYMRKMSNHLYYITSDAPSDITPSGIIDVAEQAVFRYGINGLVVDPWNGLTHENSGGEISSSYISNKLEEFRQFARINEVHVWMVAHPKKMDENAVPSMYDISGSATWYDKADCGVVIEKANEGHTRVHVEKIKFSETGEEGQADLTFVEGSEHLEYRRSP